MIIELMSNNKEIENSEVISLKFESGTINAMNLKNIIDRLQETGLECHISFAQGVKVVVKPPKKMLRVNTADL